MPCFWRKRIKSRDPLYSVRSLNVWKGDLVEGQTGHTSYVLITFCTNLVCIRCSAPRHRKIHKLAIHPESGSSGAGLSSAPHNCNAGHGCIFHSGEGCRCAAANEGGEAIDTDIISLVPPEDWTRVGGLEAGSEA